MLVAPESGVWLPSMKKRIAVLSVVMLVVVGAGYALQEYKRYDRTPGFAPLRISSTKAEPIILKTEGAPGQRFSAILTVDGSRKDISGISPAAFPLECILLVGEVTEYDGDGSFSLMIERQNAIGRFYTPPVRDLRRFRYYDNTMGVLGRE